MFTYLAIIKYVTNVTDDVWKLDDLLSALLKLSSYTVAPTDVATYLQTNTQVSAKIFYKQRNTITLDLFSTFLIYYSHEKCFMTLLHCYSDLTSSFFALNGL